ncbi:MAG: hypothetical protein NTV70_21515 [Acidobacteria bacterium]|nr:hypothetical protein [Acidobacteriota bacterium]
MKRLFLFGTLLFPGLPATAATIVTISSSIEVSATDFRGTVNNTNSGSSSTNDFRINAYTSTASYNSTASAFAGGSPGRGETFVFARAEAEWAVSSSRAVAETVYRKQFETPVAFQDRPFNFIPDLVFFAGIFNGGPSILVICELGQTCNPPPSRPSSGTGTIEFEQTLNGVLINAIRLGFSYVGSVGTLTENSCRPQPACTTLNVEQGLSSFGDPVIRSPAQWLIGPMTQVPQGTNVLEYKIRAVAEGSFGRYRGIQVHYADPATLRSPYPDGGAFGWGDPAAASTVPEPSTAATGLAALAVLACCRRGRQ